MKFELKSVIEYQKQILDRNELDFLVSYRWDGNAIEYEEAGYVSIHDRLRCKPDLDELVAIFECCNMLLEKSEELLLDAERWIWDIRHCYWNGDSIKGMYIPDRKYEEAPYAIYKQISYTMVIIMLENHWYNEKMLRLLFNIYGAALKNEIEGIKKEIQNHNMKAGEKNQDTEETAIAADAMLFQEWDMIQQEKNRDNQKRRKKLSLPFF